MKRLCRRLCSPPPNMEKNCFSSEVNCTQSVAEQGKTCANVQNGCPQERKSAAGSTAGAAAGAAALKPWKKAAGSAALKPWKKAAGSADLKPWKKAAASAALKPWKKAQW